MTTDLKNQNADFLEVPVDFFAAETITDFELYIHAAGRYLLYASSPYTWSEGERNRLLEQDHRVLYYSKNDQEKLDVYKRIVGLRAPEETIEGARRLSKLTELAADVTRIIHQHGLSMSSIGKFQSISRDMTQSIKKDKSAALALDHLLSHDQYTYFHSARVAVYAISIALEMSMSDDSELETIALGCLLHDVGKSKIDISIINKEGHLTEDEWLEIKSHTLYGQEMLNNSTLKTTAREIILHHHERLDGSGYPHQLQSSEILKEVSIASFSDVFDALTTTRSYQSSRTRYEAMDLIRFKLLKNLDQDVYKAMVSLLTQSSDDTAAS
ncbi:MAG: HD-GYP domain-containing protein [Oligoflexales bacterium]